MAARLTPGARWTALGSLEGVRRGWARDAFVVVALFSLWNGDGMRDALSWWGFGAVSITSLGVGIAVLRQERARLLPMLRSWRSAPILGFMALCLLSTAWSAYPLITVLTSLIQIATAAIGIAVLMARPVRRLVQLSAGMLHVHLVLALLFELLVALSPAGRILPLWTDYSSNVPGAYYWSSGLLLRGGRIQGIVGNANLTCFIALLALILLVVLLRARLVHPRTAVIAVAVDLLCIALTRSATVVIAGITVAAAGLLVLGYRRFGTVGKRALVVGGLVGVAGIAAGSSRLSEPLLRVLGKGDDFTGRFEIWRLVGTLVEARPVLGWGWTGWWAPWVQPFNDLVIREGVQYLQAHNAYLDVQMQLGIPGLLALVLVVGSLLWRSLRLALVPRPLTILPLLLTVALLTQGLAESRMLIEGNWALLVMLSIAVPSAAASRHALTAEALESGAVPAHAAG